MPELTWVGKDKVVNHHKDVPFKVLDRIEAYGEETATKHLQSANKVIHGDNLEALKALLPEYSGKVDCIYIDPPYNTGNEGWIYSDNVNDPHIKKWLGEVVGKEGEDFSRHDKWLCMMYPRLRLLHKLLAPEAAIFISIDDNELASLKMMCDEIFGKTCFVSNISWQRTYSTRNDSKGIVNEVEHILVYSKTPGWQPSKLARTAEMNAKYKNPDGDRSPWQSDNAFAPGAKTHQGMVYAIQHPFTGKYLYPSDNACWRYQQDEMLRIMSGWTDYELKDIEDAAQRAQICGLSEQDVRQGVKALVLSKPLTEAKKDAQKVQKNGPWPRFYFTRNGLGGIRRKTYLDAVGGRLPTNFWDYEETGHTDGAKKELKAIFDGRAPFDTPKPSKLVSYILDVAGIGSDAIVLDSFAGSGTTGHAVLKKNQEDGGNRSFILVELGDYAQDITAERLRRVINGYSSGKKDIEGTGGSFSYYELGEPLMENSLLNPVIPTEKIRQYIWYTETRENYEKQQSTNSYFLGKANDTVYYFRYEPHQETVLDKKFLASLDTNYRGSAYVIYADSCTLDAEFMMTHNIIFKKIPRDITQL